MKGSFARFSFPHVPEIRVDEKNASAHREWQTRHTKVPTKKSRRKDERARQFLVAPITRLTQIPETVRRYALTIPRFAQPHARQVGCQYDAATGIWYIDNPVDISLFSAWRPVLLNFEQQAQVAIDASRRRSTPAD